MGSGDDEGFKEPCRYCHQWFTDKEELAQHEEECKKKRSKQR